MAMKVEIGRFNGKGDFVLWRRRMYVVLVQQKVGKALGGLKCLPESLFENEKFKMIELAFSTVTLHLGDKFLCEVSETTANRLWKKLETLYITKSLSDKMYLKGKYFWFKIIESKSISENLDEFNNLVIDLENIDIKIEE